MEPAFRDPLRNGCSFQVILVHPGSKQVSIKQNAEDSSGIYGDPRDEGYLAGKIRDKLRRLENWQSQAERDPEIRAWPGAISVRCVEEIPIVNLVDNGSEALMALQVINRKGIDSPVFLLSKEGTLYKYLQSYFDFLYREMSIDGKEAATAYDKKEEGGRNPLTPNGD
jgi:hypothetical protein